MRVQSFALLAAAVALSACSGNKNTSLTPQPSREVANNLPSWFNKVPSDPNYLFATASANSRDLQIAIDKAQLAGRQQLASQFEVKFSGLQKRFQEEVGVADSSELLDQFTQSYKAVVSTVLNGTRAKEQEVKPDGPIYRAYVLMEMPIGPANAMLMQKIKQNQQMYTRFRATQAFQDLDAEVQKFEQYKKEQNVEQAGRP